MNDLRLPNRGARRRAKHAVANADKAAARRRAEDAVANADKALVEAQAALDKASVDRRTGGDCSTSRIQPRWLKYIGTPETAAWAHSSG